LARRQDMFKAYACMPGEQAVEISSNDVSARLNDGKSNVWIDISENIEGYRDFLENTMGFHQLAIDDLSSPGLLPKVEEYDGTLFLVLNDIVIAENEDEDRVRTYQLFIFLRKNALVTIHRKRIRAIDHLIGDMTSLTRLLARGAESLSHSVMMGMVDNFFPMLTRVETKLDASEETIFKSTSMEYLQEVFKLRKDVVRLHSIAQQQLNVISRLATGEFDEISPQGVLLARDIYDHLYRLSEKVAGFREETVGILDAYLSQLNNRMNDVVKVLTMIATIMLPLSIVVGFFGMNFRIMPGLNHPYGWVFTLVFMVGLITVMILYFRHKKWI
jgi:magnesium transporter